MNIVLSDFAVPSWNAVIGMHRYTRSTLHRLTKEVICQSAIKKLPECCEKQREVRFQAVKIQYLSLIRPSAKNKKAFSEFKRQNKFFMQLLACNLEKSNACKCCQGIGFDVPVSLHFEHRRKKCLDLDNLCHKFIIDGLVKTRILQDDNMRCVKKITISQQEIPKTSSAVESIAVNIFA